MRGLTAGERALVRQVFGAAIDADQVTIRRRKWFPLQPANVTMAPCGHLHFHPRSRAYCDDFGTAPLALQGHFIHELTHVWQAQTRGRWYLPLRRMPWAPYSYSLRPGWPLERYGIEQQAEIVRHAFLLRRGSRLAGVGEAAAYDQLVRFPGATL
ncbi:vgr related protein [Erythrobacteraceae bacterium CFH 75059]|uniref:vgr related protein n=1 Tax=Qipengyuania thermophila TaxID=2509361 RepID=UPI001021A0A4|nr:vgr related protein [Qipengyuania thermophila]TCD05543.1 vgr related protein [Erythrobacteraceae bacterium CFH 75059]